MRQKQNHSLEACSKYRYLSPGKLSHTITGTCSHLGIFSLTAIKTQIFLCRKTLTPQLGYMLSSGHFQFNSNVKFSPNQCVLSGCSQQDWAYSRIFKPLWNFSWANPPTFATKTPPKTWLSLTNLWPRSQHPNSNYKQVQYIAFTSMIRIAASSQERYWLVNTLHWFVMGWW